ncbi:MAG TPA: UDP-3-O-(3-hydroxymyristoyl)glucosamine N-acyltransferase [Nitrospirota bacterium]|nr:UDP-3-O-(3-hydroxymyristoyl)glucosamine N-acyltransferase [Nitrospirota bacterium]
MKLKDLADKLNAELEGPGDIEISGAAGVNNAGAGHITFIAGIDNIRQLEQSGASAAFAPLDTPKLQLPLLRVKNPRLAFARAIELLHLKPSRSIGISDKAIIGQHSVIGVESSIHPFVFIGDDATIGDRVTLYPGVYIGKGANVGDDCIIYPNVYIGYEVRIGNRVIIHAGAVIGSDGFGYATEDGKHHKIPQVGGVIIGDDVEIGANTTIDRATLGSTVIKQGTKIDNLVQIAHNVTIGEHCLLIAQVGIAGSCTLGDFVVLAGQVGLADHISIGDRTMVSAQSGIRNDIGPGQTFGGYYAMPQKDWLKVQAILPKLPELRKHIANLEKRVQELEKTISDK